MRPYRYSVYRVRFGKLRTPEGRPYIISPRSSNKKPPPIARGRKNIAFASYSITLRPLSFCVLRTLRLPL